MCDLPNAVLESGFSACQLPISVSRARTIISTGTSSLLVLERGTTSIVYLYDTDNDGMPDAKRTVAAASRLNHGLAIRNGYVYASSDTTVYRWPYEGDFVVNGDVEIVVFNMNADGNGGAPQGHTTRTLIFDDKGYLYISVGSNENVDADSHRSRIRRVALDNSSFPVDFQTMEVFADGLRNEVGLAFDSHGDLWGVENGADRLYRSDLGGDIHQDNPAEELNRFKEQDAGKHWGYPYCWTEFKLPEPPGKGNGVAWAWPSFLDSGAITDEQCRQDYVPAVVSMQGHSAPLGITFYKWKPKEELPEECSEWTAFPQYMDGYAFIAFHGSWNRDIPTGYKAVYVPMDSNGNPTSGAIDLLTHEPPNANWDNGFRPVDVSFDDCGRLLLSSDGTSGRGSSIVRIEYMGNGKPETNQPSLTPSRAPTFQPTELTSPPTLLASNLPTFVSNSPTSDPSQIPSMEISLDPTDAETNPPTVNPTTPLPSVAPTTSTPSSFPTTSPSTPFPSNMPTSSPSEATNVTACGDFNHTNPCEFSSGIRSHGGAMESLQLFTLVAVTLLWTIGR